MEQPSAKKQLFEVDYLVLHYMFPIFVPGPIPTFVPVTLPFVMPILVPPKAKETPAPSTTATSPAPDTSPPAKPAPVAEVATPPKPAPVSKESPAPEPAKASKPKPAAKTTRKRTTKKAATQKSAASSQAPESPVKIINLDKKAESVELENVSDSPVDLTGWKMVSVTGSQEHPIGDVLHPGERKLFTNNGRPIWNDSTRDDGALYDANGKLVSYWQDRV